MTARSLFFPILIVLGACANESPREPAQAPQDMSSTVRWIPARAPGSRAMLEAPARVVAVEPAAAEVSVLHRAKLVRFHVAPGDAVEAGAAIADIAAPALAEAAARLDPLSAQLEAAKSRLTTLQRLEKEGLARAEQVFALKDRVGELTVSRNVSQAVLHSYGLRASEAARIRRQGFATLTAPGAGVVTERRGHPGAVLEPGSAPLVVIEGPRKARIEASLPALPPEPTELDFVGADGQIRALKPTPVSKWVDGHSGRITVWYTPIDPAPLPDGLAGRTRVSLGAGAIEVPSPAVTPDAPRAVFVLDGDAPKRVPVEVLLDSGTTAVVRGALKVGDKVAQDAREVGP